MYLSGNILFLEITESVFTTAKKEEVIAHYKEGDLKFLKKLRDMGALVEIEKHRFEALASNRIIAIMCPDGNYFDGTYRLLKKYAPLIHPVSLLGGPLSMSPQNPLYKTDGVTLISNIERSWKKGKGGIVTPIPHWPCGAGNDWGFSAEQMVVETVSATNHLREMLSLPKKVIIPFFHLDWTPDIPPENPEAKKCRTYYLERSCL